MHAGVAGSDTSRASANAGRSSIICALPPQWSRASGARFPADAVFYIGHGGPVGAGAWEWQRGYIETFVGAVESADWSDPGDAKAAVVDAMHDYLPAEELSFLMELSVEPVAAKLGLLEPSRPQPA
jgi:hypothetical protein